MEANITYNGVPVVVVYNYYKGEEGTWDYPGSAAEAELEAMFPEDSETDILDILTWPQIQEVEDKILELEKDY